MSTEHADSLQNQERTNGRDATIFNDVTDVLDTEPYLKSLRNARTWLYVIAGFQAAMGLYEYFTLAIPQVAAIAMAIDFFIGALFLAFALWSRKKPVIAFTTALVFYIVVSVAFMALDMSNIYKGILIKILVVVALVKANKDARRYEAVKASIQTRY